MSSRKISLLTLILAFSALTSYVSTLYLIAEVLGEVGGVLDYNMFALSKVYYVTDENVRGALCYAFVDTTAYFLAALIIVNGVAWSRIEESAAVFEWRLLRKSAIFNTLLGIIALVVYVLNMVFIDGYFKQSQSSIGGVIGYFFPVGYGLTCLTGGIPASGLSSGPMPDVVSWLLFTLILGSTVVIARQLDSQLMTKN